MLNEPEILLDHKGITVSNIGDKIVKLKFEGYEKYSVEDISHLTDTVLKYYNYSPFVCLTDFTQYYGEFSSKVRRFLAQHEQLNQFKSQEAFVIRKLGMRMQANFYLKLNSSLRIKVFRFEKDALDWLMKKRKEIQV